MKRLFPYPEWAMLARNYDDVQLQYPVLVQPKLNGVRAKWDVEHRKFITRQGKEIPSHVIPHLYSEMSSLSCSYSLDGELYCHGMRFQDIAGIVSPNRATAHKEQEKIDFYVFDLIHTEDSKTRNNALDFCIGKVGTYNAYCDDDIQCFLASMLDSGYEGIMIRQLNYPYVVGRTDALVKLKPWQFHRARIIGFTKGKGKYAGMLGALTVNMCKLTGDPVYFKVSGGLDDAQRKEIWAYKERYKHRLIDIKCRELSRAGVPLQPQIVKL